MATQYLILRLELVILCYKSSLQMATNLGNVILVTSSIVFSLFIGGYIEWLRDIYICMRRTTKFRSTADRIYDGGPIRFYYNTYHCQSLLFTNECPSDCLKKQY